MSGTGAPKIVIGLVGQVCAGKSTVADAFRKSGARVYDADKSVHEIYRRPEVVAEVAAMFGPGVLDASGNVDRKALAKIVFDDGELLKRLTSTVVFPRTGVEILKEIAAFQNSDARALLLDAPALFESGRENVCDKIVYISAPLERRRLWAQARGWAPGEIDRREKMLERDAEKQRRANAFIENDGTVVNLERQAVRLMRLWTSLESSIF